MNYKTVAVVGTGTMGPGMGAVMASAGARMTLFDLDPAALERAKAGVALARGVLDKLEVVDHGGTVSFSHSLESTVADADLVIEAVPEQLALKQQVFADLERIVSPETVLASNTSGIPITSIAEHLAHPERVVGMHWSNPPHLIPMIEIIPGERTAESTTQDLADYVASFGYQAVVEKEVPGFVENRILYAILRECLALVESGIISQADMDTCVRWGIGYKLAVIGPMELLDMAGLDIYKNVGTYLNPDLSTASEVSPMIQNLASTGRLGMKTLGGIYDYTQEEVAAKRAEIAAALVAVRKALVATRP
ncbi:MAG: 3-hydroxyacyl-CoA dehydrogenase NAD-binding domain-containing protein [Acidimicrobiia bacterium]